MNRNVTALILIVLAIGIYVTFTRARVVEIQAIRDVNSQYISAIANAERLIKVRDTVQKQYNDISENDRLRLDKIIPNTVDNIRLIIDLNSIAVQHGFSLRNIKATAASAAQKQTGSTANTNQSTPVTTATAKKSTIPTPTLDTVSVSFSVTAPYQQFIDFMKSLESSLRIIDLTHLTVSANQSGMYDFNVELKTYWLRQQ